MIGEMIGETIGGQRMTKRCPKPFPNMEKRQIYLRPAIWRLLDEQAEQHGLRWQNILRMWLYKIIKENDLNGDIHQFQGNKSDED